MNAPVILMTTGAKYWQVILELKLVTDNLPRCLCSDVLAQINTSYIGKQYEAEYKIVKSKVPL